MPTYVLKNEETGDEFEQTCSYDTLQKMLEAEPNLKHLLKAPNMITDHKSVLTRAGSEWQDHLKNIKKNSGRGNTIKV
jgi:hypothetical protein